MIRILALVLTALTIFITAAPHPGAAAPSPFRAAAAVGRVGGYGALTAPDEVTAILFGATPAVTANPVSITFDLASREDSASYRASGRIICWSALGQPAPERPNAYNVQVRVKFSEPVPETIATPVAWGIASGQVTAILDGQPVRAATGDSWPAAYRNPVPGFENIRILELPGLQPIPPTLTWWGPVFDSAGRFIGVSIQLRSTGSTAVFGGLVPISNPQLCGALPAIPQSTTPAQPTISVRARGTTALAGASPTFSQRAADMIAARLRECGALFRADDTADLIVSVSITTQPSWMFAEVAVMPRALPQTGGSGYVQSKNYNLAGDVPTDEEIAAAAGWLYQQVSAGLCARR